MNKAHIYLPDGILWNLGYDGILELGFKSIVDHGKIIVEFERDNLRVLLKKLGELENRGLKYKMLIYWDDVDGYAVIQTKNWSD